MIEINSSDTTLMCRQHILSVFWNRIIAWGIIISIFFPLRLELLVLFSANLLLLQNHKFHLSPKMLLILTVIFSSSVCFLIIYGYDYGKFIQQYIVISAFSILYWNYLYQIRDSLNEFFDIYLKVAYILAFCGLLQWLFFRITGINISLRTGITTGDEKFRLTSFSLEEAGRVGTLMIPAIAYYLLKFKITQYWLQKIILLCAILLTKSFAGITIIGIILCSLLWNELKKKCFIVKLILLFICLGSILAGISYFKTASLESDRNLIFVEDLWKVISDPSLENIESCNMSVYAFTKNVWVAFHSPGRLLGTGLGTHEINHDMVYHSNHPGAVLNREDAYSLLTRIFSEFGYCGVIFFFAFIILMRNKNNAINTAILYIIIGYCIRGGSYVGNGTVLFFMLYYLTSSRVVIKEKDSGFPIVQATN